MIDTDVADGVMKNPRRSKGCLTMRFDLMTLFPEMCETVLGKASSAGRRTRACWRCIPTRSGLYPEQAETGGRLSLWRRDGDGDVRPAYCGLLPRGLRAGGERPHLIYMSPQGGDADAAKSARIIEKPHICVLCGHYEGVDERVLDAQDEQISIGDYVLTGGNCPRW